MKTDLFLFIYAMLKAFLPLPSLEAVLLPMCFLRPNKAFYYSLISAVATMMGGHIGYQISAVYGRKAILKFVSEQTLEEGIENFKKWGFLYIALGSVSPFPDFVLAYVAGLLKMNPWLFMVVDGGCRWVRSLVMIYFSSKLNELFHIERYITILSILMLVYFIGKYALKKRSEKN